MTGPSANTTGGGNNLLPIFNGGAGAGQTNITPSNLNGGTSGGSAGGLMGDTIGSGGVGSTKTNPTVSTGVYWDTGLHLGGSGGGGWAASDGTAGSGANGTSPGGAGGGGGSSVNGNNSGKGGNGADGRVEVITYF